MHPSLKLDQLLHPDSAFFDLLPWQRHLLWSLTGPSLLDCDWSPSQLPELISTDSSLDEWIQVIRALPTPAKADSARLGLVFEHLLQHWFRLQFDRVEANVQIRTPKRTLGELDLLVETNHQQWHLELAIKYYLGFNSDWIGPNRRDYLTEKIRHTETRQLQLSNLAETQEQLKDNDWKPTKKMALMRGCLFQPAHRQSKEQLPEEVSNHHWAGLWTHSDNTHLLPDGHWHLLAKDEWLSPCLVETPITLPGLLEYLEVHFKHLSIPTCLARVEKGVNGWAEQERWFLMPKDWPERN